MKKRAKSNYVDAGPNHGCCGSYSCRSRLHSGAWLCCLCRLLVNDKCLYLQEGTQTITKYPNEEIMRSWFAGFAITNCLAICQIAIAIEVYCN